MQKKQKQAGHVVMVVTRGIVYLMILAVVAVCAILLPELAREEKVANPNVGPAYPFLIGAWILPVPVFVALNQTLKLVGYIEKNKAFSNLSIKALQNIKKCAIVFTAMITITVISIIIVAKNTDPGEDVSFVVTFGFIFTFISVIIATFAAVLQRLLREALRMKEENELTV